MISVPLARTLRDAGLRWHPAAGDRFVVVDRDMDREVFVLADMTIEVLRPPGSSGDTVIGFNGTTEWALDSVDQTDAVWLPAEDQLRTRLGERFRRLEQVGGDWTVVVADHPGERVISGTPAAGPTPADPVADAYGRALLGVLDD